MKGTPQSLWLSWANRAVGAWTGMAVAAAKRNQAAVLKAMATPPKPRSKPKRKPAAKRRKGT